jgi:hypothetical protein
MPGVRANSSPDGKRDVRQYTTNLNLLPNSIGLQAYGFWDSSVSFLGFFYTGLLQSIAW